MPIKIKNLPRKKKTGSQPVKNRKSPAPSAGNSQRSNVRSSPISKMVTALAAPGTSDAILYAAALADPFGAPYAVGIPYGNAGLPTFKATKMFRATVSTVPIPVGGARTFRSVAMAETDNGLGISISYSAAGTLTFQYSVNNNLTTVVCGTATQYDHGRIVAASMRVTRMGRRDDAGLRCTETRIGYDGEEVETKFSMKDTYQMNYIPKTSWDLDYKKSVAGDPTNFTSELYTHITPNVKSTFLVDFICIVETNDDTPPAANWNTGDYHIVTPSITEVAPTILPGALNRLTQHAAQGNFVTQAVADADPASRANPNFSTSIVAATKSVDGWMSGAMDIGKALGGAWDMASKYLPMLGMLL